MGELTELPDFSLTTMKANMSSYVPGNMTRPAPPDQTQYFVWHANGTLGGHQVTWVFVGGGIFVDIELAPTVLKMMDSAPYNLDLEKKATMVMVGSGGLHHLHLQPTKATMMYFTIHSMCDELLIEEGWSAAANKYNSGKGKCEMHWYSREMSVLRNKGHADRWGVVDAFKMT